MDEQAEATSGEAVSVGKQPWLAGLSAMPLAASSALLGMSMSGYDPEKDEGASCGLHLVDLFRSLCQ